MKTSKFNHRDIVADVAKMAASLFVVVLISILIIG